MKTPIIPFLYCGILAFGLSSCGDEAAKLAEKDIELTNEVDIKRKRLNDLVRKVDELETKDLSEKLIDLELKVDAMVRQVEFEKEERVSLAEEEKDFQKQLAEFQKKYPIRD